MPVTRHCGDAKPHPPHRYFTTLMLRCPGTPVRRPNPGTSLAAIAEKTDIPKPSPHRYVSEAQ